MQIAQLIDVLRNAPPANFIWGAGACDPTRGSYTIPGDPAVREAAKKYESDPILGEIKRKFYERTLGLEDVHSCLLALNDSQRHEILPRNTNWAHLCLAELLRLGRAARVLTTNFDTTLIDATAAMEMLPPLYRRTLPELRDAITPSIYLLGEASAKTIGGLIQRGVSTGPWIVVGSSGNQFGLAQTLLSIDTFEHGLYWLGHFDKQPFADLSTLFTPNRNAHWIPGFDADSFMAYLLRGLGEFPPPAVRSSNMAGVDAGSQLYAWLASLGKKKTNPAAFKEALFEVNTLKRAPAADVRNFLEAYAHKTELATRRGVFTGLGMLACTFANCRRPAEVKRYLALAADLEETEAQANDSSGHFGALCSKLAQFSSGDAAAAWYARADATFEQMDFSPRCGAILPYGHMPKWAQLLTEWSCFEERADSEALFERARQLFLEVIKTWKGYITPPEETGQYAAFRLGMHQRRAEAAVRGLGPLIPQFVMAFQQRATRVPTARAVELLNEARPWIEEAKANPAVYHGLLCRHLLLEAQAAPDREAELLYQADEQHQTMLRLFTDQTAEALTNWGGAVGQLAESRNGQPARRLYQIAADAFRQAEILKPDYLALHKNWSSILISEARERRLPELWEQARVHANRAESLEPGTGAYNLACIAAEHNDRAGVEKWLNHCADFGKIQPWSHINRDPSLAAIRNEAWFEALVTSIFD
jgi:tetratricopeptide (TPR) repeat protein